MFYVNLPQMCFTCNEICWLIRYRMANPHITVPKPPPINEEDLDYYKRMD